MFTQEVEVAQNYKGSQLWLCRKLCIGRLHLTQPHLQRGNCVIVQSVCKLCSMSDIFIIIIKWHCCIIIHTCVIACMRSPFIFVTLFSCVQLDKYLSTSLLCDIIQAGFKSSYSPLLYTCIEASVPKHHTLTSNGVNFEDLILDQSADIYSMWKVCFHYYWKICLKDHQAEIIA